MAYYRGDYYRGDYYRGDPFLGALIGAGVKKAAGFIGSRIGRAAGRIPPALVQRATDIGGGAAAGFAAGRGRGMPELMPIGPISLAPMPGGAVAPRDPLKAMGKGGRRRINPLNPKALRRALRRAEGFEKFAARTVNSLYKVIDGRRVRTYKKKSK